MQKPITLETIRKQKQLSKYRLSKLSGLSAVYINQLEKGLKSPTERTLKKLAAALDISIADLIRADDSGAASK